MIHRRTLAMLLALGVIFGGLGVGQAAAKPLSCHKWQVIHVIDGTRIPLSRLDKVERAVDFQVNQQVRRYWNVPCLHLTDEPWQGLPQWELTLENHTEKNQQGGDILGGHGGYWLEVDTNPKDIAKQDYSSWSVVFSHEVLEQMEDPMLQTFVTGTQVPIEICDGATSWEYNVKGVRVEDFELPAEYNGHFYTAKKLDWLGME